MSETQSDTLNTHQILESSGLSRFSVYNRTKFPGFDVKFRVDYTIVGHKFHQDSGLIGPGHQTTRWVPAGAEDIILTIFYVDGFHAVELQAEGPWDGPVSECRQVEGTWPKRPQVQKMPCP